jgi:hypothetical protein
MIQPLQETLPMSDRYWLSEAQLERISLGLMSLWPEGGHDG